MGSSFLYKNSSASLVLLNTEIYEEHRHQKLENVTTCCSFCRCNFAGCFTEWTEFSQLLEAADTSAI